MFSLAYSWLATSRTLWKVSRKIVGLGWAASLRGAAVLVALLAIAWCTFGISLPPNRVYANADRTIYLSVDSRCAKLGRLEVIVDQRTVLSGTVVFKPCRGGWHSGVVLDTRKWEVSEFVLRPNDSGYTLMILGLQEFDLKPVAIY